MWLNNQNKRIFVNSANIQVAVFIRRENFIRFMKIVYCLLKKVPSLCGRENKMIVISDGDVIKNQLDKDGQPLNWVMINGLINCMPTKEFMINCVNYL
jgi:hypothetical protein